MIQVRTVVREHPFDPRTQVLEIPHGATLFDIACLYAEPRKHDHLAVFVDGTRIPRSYWRRVRPKPGRTVHVYRRWPEGSNALRLVGAIVIAAAAFMIAGPTGMLTTSQAFTTAFGTGYLASFVSGAIAAGIVTLGLWALNSLFPPEIPDTGRRRKSFTLTGVSNRLNPYGAMPVALGSVRWVPPLAAPPLTLENGRNVDLMTILLWGYGKIEISDILVGSTSIDEIGTYRMNHVVGAPGLPPELTIYTTDVYRDLVNSELSHNVPVTRTTQGETTRIQIVIQFPQGLIGYGKKTGDVLEQVVNFRIETAPAGTDTWTDHGVVTAQGATAESKLVMYEIEVPEGKYDVRVTRLSEDKYKNRDRFRDKSVFLELRSFRNAPPVTGAGLSVTELYFEASDKVSGNLDSISAIAHRVALDWDPDSQQWIERRTKNPASLVRWMLQGPAMYEPVPDSRLDLTAWQDWAEFCSDNGYECNMVIDDFGTVREAVSRVAACGRAAIEMYNGIYRPVVERPRSYPVQMFTERNVVGFSARAIHARLPHALRVRFVNEERDWKDDEIVVYADGYDESSATRFEDIDLPGITRPDLAWKFGRFRLAELYLRRERYSFETDWEGLVAGYGDLVHISHWRIAVGSRSARIRELSFDDAGNLLSIHIDESVLLEAGKPWTVRIRLADGTVEDHDIVATGTETSDLRLVQPGPSSAAVGDLCVVGEKEKVTIPALIAAIRPGGERTRIECIPYDPDLYTADQGPLPVFESRASKVPGTEYPVIISTRSDGTIATIGPNGVATIRILVMFYATGTRPSDVEGIELRWRADDEEQWKTLVVSRDAMSAVIPNAEVGRSYSIQARYRKTNGVFGVWSAPVVHTVEQEGILPPNVSTVWQDGDRIVWPEVPSPDVVGYLVGWNNSFGLPFDRAVRLTPTPVPTPHIDTSLLPNRTVEVLVVAVNAVGLTSPRPARMTWIPDTAVLDYEPIATVSRAATGWPGSLQDATISNGQLVPNGTETWAPNPNAVLWPDPDAPAFPQSFEYMIYETDLSRDEFDTGGLPIRNDDRITVDVQASYGIAEVMYRTDINDFEEEPFDDGTWFDDGTGFIAPQDYDYIHVPKYLAVPSSGEKITFRIRHDSPVDDVVFSLVAPVRRFRTKVNIVDSMPVTVTLPAEARKIVTKVAIGDGSGISPYVRELGGTPLSVEVGNSKDVIASGTVDLVVEYV